MAVNSFNAQNPPVNTKGDLFTFSTIPTKLGVGANNTVLTADSTTATGLKWATAGASGPAFSARNNVTQSITASTYTKVTFDVELFDTDNCFASNRFTPNKAGYYQINTMVMALNGSSNTCWIMAYKNGSFDRYVSRFDSSAGTGAGSPFLMYFNGSTDYLEIYVYLGGSSPEVQAKSFFDGVWIRS